MKHTIYFLIIFLGIHVSAFQTSGKSLVISDVDDTIKLSNVPDFFGSLDYGIDEYSHFTGMNSLYQLIQKSNPDADFYYVSKAPEWALKTIHENFLVRAKFPVGTYIGQSEYGPEEHKVRTIRDIIKRHRPQRVLFIGDNGQQDADVYERLTAEYASSEIHFLQYIHVVYSSDQVERSLITSQQIGFVTAIELGEDLTEKGWLTPAAQIWMKENILPRILKEVPDRSQGAVAFPPFMDCQEIEWRWNIPGLNEKISGHCR